MAHEGIEFGKATFVEKKLDPLASGQLTFPVVAGDAFRPSALLGGLAPEFKFGH
jgi:hypothetical protein